MDINWKCTIDICKEEAHYHLWPNYYCHYHWDTYLKESPNITEEEIKKRNEEWRSQCKSE